MTGSAQSTRVSIHDVARRAGVSAATVSKVLRGRKSVRRANAQRVEEAVRALGYRMDPLAAGLRAETRRIIGLIVPDLESAFFGRITSQVELLAEAEGYSLTIASSHEDEAREAHLVRRMSDWRVAGTLLAPVRSAQGAGATELAARNMTAVLLDRAGPHDRFDTVTADNAQASAGAARRLIGDGHRHIALFGLSDVSRNIRTRIEAFRAAAAEIDPATRVDVLAGSGASKRLAAYLRHTRPSAIFALFATGTLEVLSEFRRQDIRCPDDIALIGFDDADWMAVAHPSVTTLAQPVAEMASDAFQRLMARIAGERGAPTRHLAPCRLIERQSLGDSRAFADDKTETRRGRGAVGAHP